VFRLAIKTIIVGLLICFHLSASALSMVLQQPAEESREITADATRGVSKLKNVQSGFANAPVGPFLSVTAQKIDLGAVFSGEKITGQLMIQNTGTEVLRWTAAIPATPAISAVGAAGGGRFISFQNRDVATTGVYLPPAHIRDQLDVTGRWSEEGGYPVGYPPSATLMFRFLGSAVKLINMRKSEEGALAVLIDDQPIILPLDQVEGGGYIDPHMIQGLPDTHHTLTIIGRDARLTMEGVMTFDREIIRFPAGVVKFFPRSGTTTRETDYLTISIDTRNLKPGLYLEYLEISSNGGQETVLMYLDVLSAGLTRLLDVHRYVKGREYLFSVNIPADSKRIFVNGYEKQGIAFQLFAPGTPGTTEFFRWYNPHVGDYFYSYQRQGGGKSLSGYIFDGAIGNIATSRIASTRPLHRWINEKTGRHFFTVDPKGEDIRKQGYRYDGISGFVR